MDASAEDFVAVAKDAGGVDVVLDMVGGDYVARGFETLNTGGRIVMIATLGGANVELNLGRIMQKRAVMTGSTLRPRDADEKARLAAEVERVVWPWIEAGKVRTIVDATFPSPSRQGPRPPRRQRPHGQDRAGGLGSGTTQFDLERYQRT